MGCSCVPWVQVVSSVRYCWGKSKLVAFCDGLRNNILDLFRVIAISVGGIAPRQSACQQSCFRLGFPNRERWLGAVRTPSSRRGCRQLVSQILLLQPYRGLRRHPVLPLQLRYNDHPIPFLDMDRQPGRADSRSTILHLQMVDPDRGMILVYCAAGETILRLINQCGELQPRKVARSSQATS